MDPGNCVIVSYLVYDVPVASIRNRMLCTELIA